jgi:hypothetical protein
MALQAARIHQNARERVMSPIGAAGGEGVMIFGGAARHRKPPAAAALHASPADDYKPNRRYSPELRQDWRAPQKPQNTAPAGSACRHWRQYVMAG